MNTDDIFRGTENSFGGLRPGLNQLPIEWPGIEASGVFAWEQTGGILLDSRYKLHKAVVDYVNQYSQYFISLKFDRGIFDFNFVQVGSKVTERVGRDVTGETLRQMTQVNYSRFGIGGHMAEVFTLFTNIVLEKKYIPYHGLYMIGGKRLHSISLSCFPYRATQSEPIDVVLGGCIILPIRSN